MAEKKKPKLRKVAKTPVYANPHVVAAPHAWSPDDGMNHPWNHGKGEILPKVGPSTIGAVRTPPGETPPVIGPCGCEIYQTCDGCRDEKHAKPRDEKGPTT